MPEQVLKPLVEEASDALLGEKFKHQRDAQVRRRQVRKQQLRLLLRNIPVKVLEVSRVKHVVLADRDLFRANLHPLARVGQ